LSCQDGRFYFGASMQLFTREFFDALVIVVIIIGLAWAVVRLYADLTRPLPEVMIHPPMPEVAAGSITVRGIKITPGLQYVVAIDDVMTIDAGEVQSDGTFERIIALPPELAPGVHMLQVCVDCRRGGRNLVFRYVIQTAGLEPAVMDEDTQPNAPQSNEV